MLMKTIKQEVKAEMKQYENLKSHLENLVWTIQNEHLPFPIDPESSDKELISVNRVLRLVNESIESLESHLDDLENE